MSCSSSERKPVNNPAARAIMNTLALAATLAALPSLAAAATVDAGALTTVTAEASLYDTSLSADNGCDPSGCVAALTRVSGVGAQLALVQQFFRQMSTGAFDA